MHTNVCVFSGAIMVNVWKLDKDQRPLMVDGASGRNGQTAVELVVVE